MKSVKKTGSDLRLAFGALMSLVVLNSCGQQTISLVTEIDGSPGSDTTTEEDSETEPTDGIDIGIDTIDIKVPAVDQGGSYPAGEPVVEIEFVIKNYSIAYCVPEGTKIPWVVVFGQYVENYTTASLGSDFGPDATYTIMNSIAPDGVVSAPDSGEHAFCIRTLLFGDVNPTNDELCLYYTVE